MLYIYIYKVFTHTSHITRVFETSPRLGIGRQDIHLSRFRVASVRHIRHPEAQEDGLPGAAAEVEGLGLAERLVAQGVADFEGLAIQLEGLSWTIWLDR